MTTKIVSFALPQKSMKVGTWARVLVIIEPSSRLKLEDIDFVVPKGLCGGLVSVSRDRTFDPIHPTIMLCAGYMPGKYKLLAVDKVTKSRLGQTQFEVIPVMGDSEVGPSLWFEGKIEGFVRGATWGGGIDGPENINISPYSGKWAVAILLVDTADHRYPDDEATVQGFKDHWAKESFSMDPDPGVRSVAKYYAEVSYGNLKVTGEVFGLAHLPGNWSDYFNERTHPDPNDPSQIIHEDVWDPNPDLAQACFTAADDLIDYREFNSLVMVMPSTKPGSGVWPQAWGCSPITAEGNINYSVIVMPNEMQIPHPTLAHELGHNFGLPDLYKPHYLPNSSQTDMQNLGDWDLMHWEGQLPQMCVLSRMAKGWIDPAWIKTYNFANQQPTPPVDEIVTLHQLESVPPPAGRYSAIEIRLAPGRNYYVEYRAPLQGQISDQKLPRPSSVLVTDAALPSPNETVPYDRPRVMFVRKDRDGDGPVLRNTQDFRDTDITSLAHDPLLVFVSGINGSKADITVRYGPAGIPDPYIRPWPASPDRQWQSPDIEVRNPRSLAYPEWWNMPWEGHENTIIARVTNGGALNAPGVIVDFYVQPYDAAGYTIGAPSYIGSDRRDIQAGEVVEFSTKWTPPDQGHRCISVDIPPYSAPGTPPVPELTDRNNFAQSNYVKYISRSASPSTRESVSFGVNNPFNYRTGVFILPRQTHPHYRTYLAHTYLTLDPGERREVEIMFEHIQSEDKNTETEFSRIPNHLSVTAFIVLQDPPQSNGPNGYLTDGTPQPLGGVDIDVVAARATRFASFEIYGGRGEARVRGTIVSVDDENPVPDGKILLVDSPIPHRWPPVSLPQNEPTKLSLHPEILRFPRGKNYQEVAIKNGSFDIAAPSGRMLSAYYGGAPGYGDCYSDTLRVPV